MNELENFDFNEKLFDFWQNMSLNKTRGSNCFPKSQYARINVIVRAPDKSNIYTV
jgi:hypothetical protein